MRFQKIYAALGISLITTAAIGCLTSSDDVDVSDQDQLPDRMTEPTRPIDDGGEQGTSPLPGDEIEFEEGETIITDGPVICDTTTKGELNADGPNCAPGDVVLEKDVWVLKRDPTNHVSAGGKEINNNGSESNCSGNPPLCSRSTHHGYGQMFKVKVTCSKDAMQNPTALFATTLGVSDKFPKVEGGHTHWGDGYACAKGTGLAGLGVSSACKTVATAQISPQQTVQGAPAGNVFQDLYVAYAATHCPRQLFQNVPSPDSCNAPELNVEVKGVGFGFTPKNHTYAGKKKVSCSASCGAATPTLDCNVVEDGDL